MDTGLTTIDGFPRSDIDVATGRPRTHYELTLTGPVRTTRARIIHLRNDYKALMAKVEVALHEQFAALEAQGSTNTTTAATDPAPSIPIRPATGRSAPSDTPFATVDEVTAGSPAATSGLQVGDEISRFGAANHVNHDRLKKVAEVVTQNEGVSCRNLWDGTNANHSGQYPCLWCEEDQKFD
jgi:26S proteasome regulatory subunit N4